MAAGSQSVEFWAKKLDPVQLGKKIHFSLEIARCSTRARLPKGCKTFRNLSFIFSIHMFFFTFLFPKPPESEVAWTSGLIDPVCSVIVRRAFTSYPSLEHPTGGRDNVMSYVISGGWEGFQFRGERERDREIEVYLRRTNSLLWIFTYVPVPCIGTGIAFHKERLVFQIAWSWPNFSNICSLNGCENWRT